MAGFRGGVGAQGVIDDQAGGIAPAFGEKGQTEAVGAAADGDGDAPGGGPWFGCRHRIGEEE